MSTRPDATTPATERSRRWGARLAAVLAGVAIVLGFGVVGTAQAAEPGITTNCGRITCSDYVSREGTRQMLDMMNSPDNPTKVLSNTACALGGGRVSPVCKLAKVAIKFGEAMTRRTLESAVNDHGAAGACFKITYVRGTDVPTYVSTNNGQYCHDR
jgi:hypothetical protein